MCGGSRPKPATITVPDYGQYNRQFDLQKAAIDKTMSDALTATQNRLDAALRKQNEVKERVADIVTEKAEEQEALEEEAKRLSVLLGPPPPEKNAQSVKIGDRDEDSKGKKGKSSLRIKRTTATSSGQGTGLNIRT